MVGWTKTNASHTGKYNRSNECNSRVSRLNARLAADDSHHVSLHLHFHRKALVHLELEQGVIITILLRIGQIFVGVLFCDQDFKEFLCPAMMIASSTTVDAAERSGPVCNSVLDTYGLVSSTYIHPVCQLRDCRTF
jgi:hypothetical protein